MSSEPRPEDVAREKLRVDAAVAAKQLGIENQYAELMAKFEAAKAALSTPPAFVT